MATTPDDGSRRPRRVLPIFLILLATLIGIVSVLALWVKRQALETDTWVDTSTELLEDETISDAVGDFLVAALFDNVDVEGEIAAQLPPQAQPLAGPVAGGLRQLADRAADQALQSAEAQAVWEDANRAAHERLLALLDDEGEFVSTTGGVVALDLTGLVTQLSANIGLPGGLAAKLPPEAASIEIMDSDELSAAQTGVKALRTIAYILTALALILYALAIFLARDRRRETLRAVGFSFLVVGPSRSSPATPAAAPSRARWRARPRRSHRSQTRGRSGPRCSRTSVSPCSRTASSSSSRHGSRARPWATSIRHALTPYLRQPAYAFGGLAVLLLLLFWWDPVVATHRLAPSLLLIVLLAIGVEALRRQVIREFPDHVTPGSPAGVAQWMAGRMSEARESKVGARGRRDGAARGSEPGWPLSPGGCSA